MRAIVVTEGDKELLPDGGGVPGCAGSSITFAATLGAAASPSRRQKRSQPSSRSRLPSSHVSFSSSTLSPQRAREQLVLHASAAMSLLSTPSSHSSPASRVPLPQKRDRNRQSVPQRYGRPGSWRDSSHCSPSSFWTMPSPQTPTSRRHCALQPSKSRRLLSSHSSSFTRTPSPHFWIKPASKKQEVLHPSPLRLLPSSHCSPGSSTRLPQVVAVTI